MQPGLFAKPNWTVTELTRYLRQLLEGDAALQDVWVSGEISNIKQATSGHIYFTLKDSGAALQCVIWRSAAARIRMGLQNGLAIEAHGAIGLYERDGSYQLIVTAVRLAGEGRLYQEFLRLKARLEAEGLFDEDRKRPIPERPRRIGIVTSATGAALQDMLNTLRGRYPMVEVLLAPAAVQGDEAPPQIVAALDLLQRQVPPPDVILMARGGGSLEDLWAFNDERVVRAVAHSAIPVVTGVGHETDFTLADFASDLRAPTLTGAAVLATPDRSDLLAELQVQYGHLAANFLGILQSCRSSLGESTYRLGRASPMRRIQDDRQELDGTLERMARAFQHEMQLRRMRQQSLQQRLSSLNPLSVLQRGFAVVNGPDGGLVRSIAQVRAGDKVRVRLMDGSFSAMIDDISKDQKAE